MIDPAEGYFGSSDRTAQVAQVESLFNQANKNDLPLLQIIVQQGETLWELAQMYHTSVREIAALNQISTPDRILTGWKLWINTDESTQRQASSPEKGNSNGLSSTASMSTKATVPKPDQVIPIKNSSRGQTSEAVSREDLDLLAHVIYAEARGEKFEGQVAVGAVVLNRVQDPHFPKTIRGVIYQKGAFTAVADNQILLKPDAEAYRAAEEALEGVDPTNGALYYFNPKLATDNWIRSLPVVKQIGNHIFSI